jgi:hypothetical protein
MTKGVTIIEAKQSEEDYDSDMALSPPRESTPLLSSQRASDRSELFSSFRRQRSSVRGGDENFAEPVEGLAPLFPGGIAAFEDRQFVPFREASLVKSVPAFAPYGRKARHRNFHLYWLNVSRLIV